jgi:pimeloyl-ACP methyl ester carboxylesterase
MTYNDSVKILGFINVEGGLYRDGSIFKRLMGPVASKYRTILVDPPSVDAFQENVLGFLHLCSEKLPPKLFRILLEGMIQQPRRAAELVHQRTHNPEKMMQEARSGKLPLLAISGGKDNVVVAGEFKTVVEASGWKELVYRHLEDADHIPWVSCPEEFRGVVLAWLKDLTRMEGESSVL